MKKIVVKVQGGLGNQLFQYCAGRAAAKRTKATLVLDLSWFGDTRGGHTAREFDLEKLGLSVARTTWREWLPLQAARFGLNVMIPARYRISAWREKGFQYDAELAFARHSMHLIGYFQSYKYFEAISSEVRSEVGSASQVTLQGDELFSAIKNSQSVAVHIRRGDYLKDKAANLKHGMCSIDYYRMAAQLISDRLSNPKFFVFSDDIEWCQQNIDIQGAQFVSERQPMGAIREFFLMTACRHQIIANSTFSWWAAYLNDHEQKIVVAPNDWFAKPGMAAVDLIPNDWIKM